MRHRLTAFISLLVFIFLLVPLVIIVMTSFGTEATIQFPIQGFTLDWYGYVLTSPMFMDSFVTSFLIGALATLASLIIGVPTAYFMTRFVKRGRQWLNAYFLSPTIIPGIVIGYALFQMVIVKMGWQVFPALFMGHLIISLPYIIRVVGSSLLHLDLSIEEAAWTLGMTKSQTFFKIVLPNLSSGIFAASLLAFVNSFNNIPVSMFLTGPGITTLPTTILSYMEYNYNPAVSAISTLLMLVTLGIMYLIDKTLGLSAIM